MKIKLLCVLALVCLVSSAFGQSNPLSVKEQVKKFRNSKRFAVRYDKFKDRTWVSAWFATGSKYGGSLAGMITFKGETSDGPPTFFFIFTSYGSNWRHLEQEDRRLYAIIDGERLRLGIGERDSDVSTGTFTRSVIVNEQISFSMDAEAFTKLATSKSVELKVGRNEFKLKDEHQEAFRDLLSLAP